MSDILFMPHFVNKLLWKFDIDELVQERHNSVANALELRLSCTNHRFDTKGENYKNIFWELLRAVKNNSAWDYRLTMVVCLWYNWQISDLVFQGSSRSVVMMDWDKIWAFNKKVIIIITLVFMFFFCVANACLEDGGVVF